MDIADLLSKWCDHFTDVMQDNPGDPHCPACAAFIELERLRGQVAELLPFAITRSQQTLDNWREDYIPMEEIIDAANRLGRMKNGEFGKVQWPNG